MAKLYTIDAKARSGNVYTPLFELNSNMLAEAKMDSVRLEPGCCGQDVCIVCRNNGFECAMKSLRLVDEPANVCAALLKWQCDDCSNLAERIVQKLSRIPYLTKMNNEVVLRVCGRSRD
jgi:hypothetical protein